MSEKLYKSRLIDRKIEEYLHIFGAVCIEGPKWCGKTWTSKNHAASSIMLGDPRNNFQNREFAKIDPETTLVGETPRLIDEWQEVPEIWDAVRYKVDEVGEKGQFILTGSSTPTHKGILHSGAGRIGRLRMNTMSLFESGESSGKVSLKGLFEGDFSASITGEVNIKDLIHYIIRGGWPGGLAFSAKESMTMAREYINAVIKDDVYRIDGVKRNENKMKLLLRSLARNESTTVSNRVLQRDVEEIQKAENNGEASINIGTVTEYLDIFERLFLIDNQKPFAESIRSSVRVKQAVKRHFTDPSLACAVLNISPEMLLNDLETLGFMFEALCERDLKIYANAIGGELYHYQDYKNREIDAVIELDDGRWGAFEIKLGAHQIDQAAAQLLMIRDEFREDIKAREPSILCVICGMSNTAYQREDGVYVLPITALKD